MINDKKLIIINIPLFLAHLTWKTEFCLFGGMQERGEKAKVRIWKEVARDRMHILPIFGHFQRIQKQIVIL